MYGGIMSALAEVGVLAAGAPSAQILIATLFGLGTTALLALMVSRHLSGKGPLLARAGAVCERAIGLPSWAALGFVVAMQGLVFGGAGVFWDVSLHIDQGRDGGPLANPSHYPILWALYSIFAAGVLSVALHQRAEVRSLRAVVRATSEGSGGGPAEESRRNRRAALAAGGQRVRARA